MVGKPRSDGKTWEALQGLDDDLLDPAMPEELVEAELRAVGIESASLADAAKRLAAVAEEAGRLAWKARAAKRRAELTARLPATTGKVALTRAEMLERLAALRAASGDTGGGAIRLAARKRKAEESTDEELWALLQEMEALRALEGDDR